MRFLGIFFYLAIGISGFSQDLAVSNLDESLTKRVNVVVRNSIREFDVVSPGKAIEIYRLELTILNEAGKAEAYQYVMYSDLEKVLDITGEIYNSSGTRVRKIKKAEIEDISATGGSMYTDNRVKILDFTYPSYPYSIVFTYKLMHDGLMFYPNWYPQENHKTSVEQAEFIVRVPESIGLNYYEHMVTGEQLTDGGDLVYKWQVSNSYGYELEPYGPPSRELSPYVLLTPKKFEMEGYEGSMDTWESIGAYDYELIKDRGELPEEAKKEIEERLKGVTDKREKARIIYEYMQNSTRYVSVQLGIGGWRPYDAKYVYENGYGDCKALTNYTAALLRHAGVESIYTSVLAGGDKPDIVTDFPNARFNHVFLAVPLEEDTVWLECTSQTTPFGYLGTFTSNRHVLMTTPEGGKLVKTPAYTEEDNIQYRVAEVDLLKNGDAKAKITTEYAGIQYENVRRQLHESPAEQKKWLMSKVDFDNTKIIDFNLKKLTPNCKT